MEIFEKLKIASINCREACPFYHNVPKEFRAYSGLHGEYIGCAYDNIIQ